MVPVFILINYGSSANICMFYLIISNLLEPVYKGVTNGGRGGAVAPGEAGQPCQKHFTTNEHKKIDKVRSISQKL